MRLVLLAAVSASVQALRVPLMAPQRVSTRTVTPMLVATLEETIQQTTANNEVVIYSKSWCPYCAQCKALFDDMAIDYTAVELDERDDGDQLQAALLEVTKQRMVPNVFVNGQHLGGSDDTQQAARSGKLAELLLKADAVTGRVVLTGAGASGATAAQLKAVKDNKMITETEATIRKVAGVGLGLATAFNYFTAGMAYTTLSAGIFGALSVYRSGASYQ